MFDELDFSFNTFLFKGTHCNEVSYLGKISVTDFGHRIDSSCSANPIVSPDKIPNVNMELPLEVTPLASRSNDLPDSGCDDTSATNTRSQF